MKKSYLIIFLTIIAVLQIVIVLQNAGIVPTYKSSTVLLRNEETTGLLGRHKKPIDVNIVKIKPNIYGEVGRISRGTRAVPVRVLNFPIQY